MENYFCPSCSSSWTVFSTESRGTIPDNLSVIVQFPSVDWAWFHSKLLVPLTLGFSILHLYISRLVCIIWLLFDWLVVLFLCWFKLYHRLVWDSIALWKNYWGLSSVSWIICTWISLYHSKSSSGGRGTSAKTIPQLDSPLLGHVTEGDGLGRYMHYVHCFPVLPYLTPCLVGNHWKGNVAAVCIHVWVEPLCIIVLSSLEKGPNKKVTRGGSGNMAGMELEAGRVGSRANPEAQVLNEGNLFLL